jgi:hypothetical protein
MRAPAEALMSKPSPERFNNPWWVIGDVIGWIDDRNPAQFGRIATAADLPRLRFECDSEVRESRPEIKLLRALERGDLVAYDPINRQSVPREFWRFKNEGDLHALFARGLSFRRDDVLRLWPGDEAQSGSVLAAPLDDGATLAKERRQTPRPRPKLEAVKNWIARQYPNGIRADKTVKALTRDFGQQTGVTVNERTVRRALGRK